MTTKQHILNLISPTTTTYDRAESLFVLTKHNAMTSLKARLTECYINEDYATAYNLVKGITITTLKPRYTKHTPKTRRGDSRTTVGITMATQGDNTGWLAGIATMRRLNLLQEIKTSPLFLNRTALLKKIMKRKARLARAKSKRVSINGKATKYTKGAKVVLPSSLA